MEEDDDVECGPWSSWKDVESGENDEAAGGGPSSPPAMTAGGANMGAVGSCGGVYWVWIGKNMRGSTRTEERSSARLGDRREAAY